MLIEEHFAIKAPISKVWDFLLNAQALASCVPGCEGVEVVDENTYVTSIKVKVGPISARFKMRLTIVEREPPRRLLTTGKGEDSKMASSLVSKNEIKLNVISEKETDFYYRSDVSVLGTLGKFGEGIMRKKAKDVGEQFAQALKSKIEMEQ
ncbi:MAG: SRPBCC domain-containing protein [Thermodesulfobacteriota bacterium]|nr:SRPBCC domain-containing protein [Thermodesulfobacteriota bacterium]